MRVWKDATRAEQIQFLAIEELFSTSPHLMDYLFDANSPKLKYPADDILQFCGSFSSGDRLLIKIALDIWCDSGSAKIYELIGADSVILNSAISSLSILSRSS
jgi:hypothetical protein